jgi:hypothetical protein
VLWVIFHQRSAKNFELFFATLVEIAAGKMAPSDDMFKFADSGLRLSHEDQKAHKRKVLKTRKPLCT